MIRRVVAVALVAAVGAFVAPAAEAASARGVHAKKQQRRAKRPARPRVASWSVTGLGGGSGLRWAAPGGAVTFATPLEAPVEADVPAGTEESDEAETPVATPACDPDPGVQRVQVRSLEFSLTLSRPCVAAGDVDVELNNSGGEDPHDLHLDPAAGGGEAFAIPELASGEVAGRTFALQAGAYRLYCSLPAHADLGMRATLSVR